MRILHARLITLLVAAVFMLVACGTSEPQTQAADPNDAESSEESSEPDNQSTVTSSTTTTIDASAVEDEADNDIDPDRSPPTTETEGLASNAEAAAAPDLSELSCWRVENFGEEAADRWQVINDGVMGGLSEGELAFEGGAAIFNGTINTNGGGFSMIRTSVLRDGQSLADALVGAEYLLIRTRSANGRGYELTVQDSTTNSAVMHLTDIAISADSAWEEPLVPLVNLEARTFANAGPALADFDLAQISTLGIILADGFDGPFSLAIDRIDACARP